MFPAFWRKFLFEFTVYGCLRHTLHRPHGTSEMSQRVSFHISVIVSLSESFCWSVYISVCTCVSLLSSVESRRVVVWALPREVAVHRNARCRALVQTNGHSMPWTKLTNGWKLPSANRGVAPRQSSEPSRTQEQSVETRWLHMRLELKR